MPRVLIISDDRLGATMAGPAIRAYELARHLATFQTTELASLQASQDQLPGVTIHSGLDSSALLNLAKNFDVLVAGSYILAQHAELTKLGKYLVLDLYDPMLFEELAHQEANSLGKFLYFEHHRYLARQMKAADFMICASDRQRDYWLGRLCALGRLDPELYAQDPTARRLIDLVPFGLDSNPPIPGPARLRGVLPGVKEEDVLFLWGGGLWEWFDPLTPIRAISRLRTEHPELKLIFMAGKSPNPTTPAMPMAEKARSLASDLGVLDQTVHFLDEWVPYQERGSLLLEADAAFSAHQDHLETRFAFRTRILDYLWASLPILTTTGDAMADLVSRSNLGQAIAPQDVEGWEKALLRMGKDLAWRRACKERVGEMTQEFTWTRAIAPLKAYCEAPYFTPKPRQESWSTPFPLLTKAGLALKDEGLEGLVKRGKRYLARRSRHE